MQTETVTFRQAQIQDVPLVLSFIRELAEYEKLLDQVVATEEGLRYWLFEKRSAEVLFLLEDGQEVGFALFFHNFPPSWAGQGCIWRISMCAPPTGARAMAKP